MIYVYVWFGAFAILQFPTRRQSGPFFRNVFLLCTSVLFLFFLLETVLIMTGTYLTYMERLNHAYVSPYAYANSSPYNVWPTAGKPHWLTKPEYSYSRPTNSLGFADMEWPKSKRPGEKRILALGDSFTEGDGASYDSSYVAIFRQCLRAAGDSSYIMNAGICGSDPCNNYIIYRDLLQPYQPNVIIQSMGSGDLIAEILLRGGMERFQKDGTVKFRPAPWWEPIYAESYLSRIFFRSAGYTELLRKKDPSPPEIERITKSAMDLFDAYADLCRKNGTKLFIVLHPERNEVDNNQYNYNFTALIDHLRNTDHIEVLDLLPLYRSYIEAHHSHSADYFWKMDGHHNSKGYQMMAETTCQGLSPFLRDSAVAENK